MFETLGNFFHGFVGVCYIINPFMMIIMTFMWMGLKKRMDKELRRMSLSFYALEYFNYMTRTYQELEDKMNE